MNFSSDNAGPAAPEIIEAVAKANDGYAKAYGADELTGSVQRKIREIFDAPDAVVHLVATGTAANSLAIACLCPPWATVYCHRNSHVEEDECGAPEFFTGGSKLTLLDGPHAKIQLQSFRDAVGWTARAGVHNVQAGAFSMTNSTENGTAYTCEEVSALCGLAAENRLPSHVDGARFANALTAIGCAPSELSWRAGVDMLSLGGTKNGLIAAEAVVIFDPSKAWEFELRRKRGGHLFSKYRYLSAQMDAYLTDGLWLRLASRANAAAAKLADGLAKLGHVEFQHPRETNMVFASWPRETHRRAFSKGANYYLWPFNQSLEGDGAKPLSARLVCNWATSDEEIEQFLSAVR